jgi:hypothetical protein
VLTTSAKVPTEFLAVRGYCALNLQQVFAAKPDALVIDHQRFAAWIRAFSLKPGRRLAGRGGRPSKATLIGEVFQARRGRALPYRSKSAEAKEIIAEWAAHYPDSDPPGDSTIRKHLPDSVKCDRQSRR